MYDPVSIENGKRYKFKIIKKGSSVVGIIPDTQKSPTYLYCVDIDKSCLIQSKEDQNQIIFEGTIIRVEEQKIVGLSIICYKISLSDVIYVDR